MKKIKKEIFEPYTLNIEGIKIKDIEKWQVFDYVEECARKMAENQDNVYYEFLTKNGYKIDRPYNFKQLEEIKENLKKKDKSLDKIEGFKIFAIKKA